MLPLNCLDLSAAQVEERFDTAVRNGNFLWLWPEVPVEAWQSSLRQIELITRQILLYGRSTYALTGSTEAICVAAFTSGMGPMLGFWAGQDMLEAPDDVIEMLKLHYRHNVMRMANLAERARVAAERLASKGVRAVVLKGMQSAFAYFPTPGCRPLSDIDFLISPADTDICNEALSELGYLPGRTGSFPSPPQQVWQMPTALHPPRSVMLTHWDNPWFIDLQTSLSRAYSTGAQLIELDGLSRPDLLDDWAFCPSAKALSPVPMVLHLACHASCGLENLMLLRLTELVFAIRKGTLEKRFSWDHFMALAEANGTLPSAFPALYLTELLCPGTVAQFVLQEGEAQAPKAVRRVVHRLQPASAQRVMRCSLEEKFMWTNSLSGLITQASSYFFPRGIRLTEFLKICRIRVFRVLRGELSLTAPDAF